MSVSLGYTGLTGSNLSWGGSGNALININQLDPKYQSAGRRLHARAGAEPVLRRRRAPASSRRSATIERGQLLRPFPQFGNVYMQQSTGAHSQYHAGIFQLRKRVTGLWGGNFSYTYSRLNDNQFGESNYYSSAPGPAEQLHRDSGLAVLQPGSGVRPQPARLAAQDRHRADRACCRSARASKFRRTAASPNVLLGGWSITPVVTLQSGFPIGVSQNVDRHSFLFGGTPRPNIVAGPGLPGAAATSPIASRRTPPTTST